MFKEIYIILLEKSTEFVYKRIIDYHLKDCMKRELKIITITGEVNTMLDVV